jgi:hypothetical protein
MRGTTAVSFARTSPHAEDAHLDFNTYGPLGILWAGLGLGAFYIALIWLNTLLGVFLTPFFIIPQTWLYDWLRARRARRRN